MKQIDKEKIIEKYIMEIVIKCGVFNDSDYAKKLSYCLWLVRKYITKMESKFLYDKPQLSTPTQSQNQSKIQTEATITIKQRIIRYEKIPNQENIFREFLHKNINFRTDDNFSRERSVDSYISRLNSLSREIASHCGENFHFLCFKGANEDIDFIFKVIAESNIFSDKFITDSNSAIEHYKNFIMQALHK